MAVLRWDPWGDVMALQRDVNELFNRSFGSDRAGALVPPIDAYRTDEGVVVRMELPGMKPEQVDISVQDNVLTVSGDRVLPAEVDSESWLRRERPVGTFERSFTLPEGTDPDKIAASFDMGVLTLHIPHPPERQPRRISIATGGEARAVDARAES